VINSDGVPLTLGRTQRLASKGQTIGVDRPRRRMLISRLHPPTRLVRPAPHPGLDTRRADRSRQRISILAAELDAYPELMNTLSGVVDLRTGEIRPHDPKLLLTRITACPADINAPHPRWDAFLAETFNGNREMTAYRQRLAGLALLGKTPEHVFPFFWARGPTERP
jgi:hypothetical protein